MNSHENLHEINVGVPRSESAVSIYGQNDALDDFPVLKAFQQYIDAEQNKARKRLVLLCIFFGFLMAVIVAVFVIMLQNVSMRNQALNDRLVEYAMKDRDRGSSAPVVVQSAPPQDSSALIALTAKLETLQRQLEENSRKTAENAPADAKRAVAPPSAPSASDIGREERLQAEKAALERARLKLKIEQDKLAEEKERLRKEEVERNRRRIYADYYAKQEQKRRQSQSAEQPSEVLDDKEIELDDDDAIEYFTSPSPSRTSERKNRKAGDSAGEKRQAPERKASGIEELPAKEYFDIPVEVKGSSSSWSIPEE
jgi:hypothetical protein